MKISEGEIDIDKAIEFFIMAIICTVFLYLLNVGIHSQRYIQAVPIFMKLISFIFFLFLISEEVKDIKTVDIYEDRICIKYFGIKLQKIKYSSIKTYTTFIIENNHYLQIEISKNTITINRSLLSNSSELIDKFNEFSHKRNPHNKTEYFRKKKNREAIIRGLGGCLVLLVAIFIYLTKDEVKNRNELVTINGYLNGPFEIIRPAAKKSKHIYFRSLNAPGFRFEVNTLGYNLIDLHKLETYTTLDTLELIIEKSEHEAKILASREPSFFEKHFYWINITVYELKVNKKTIFTLDQMMNEEKKRPFESNNILSIFIGTIGIIMILRAKKAYIKPI